MDPVTALHLLGDAARRNAIVALGVSGFDLRSALLAGTVKRPVRGTYALPRAPREIVAAASLRGQLACVSACAHYGLRLVTRPDVPHILVPLDRHPQDERVLGRLHLTGVHRDPDFVPGRLVQPIDAALDHAAWCTTPLEHLVVIDSAMNKRRIDPLSPPTLTKADQQRRSWLLRNASGTSDSISETVAHALLNAAGLNPRPQVKRDRVGHVDFAVGPRHIVEVDGYKFHSSKAAFREDRRRDREVAAARDWPLRYTYWDVMEDPLRFALDVARITGLSPDSRLAARYEWMTAVPPGHLNRRS